MILRLDWSLLRRAHQLVLLTTLVLLWGLAVTSFFVLNADSYTARSPSQLPLGEGYAVTIRPDAKAVEQLQARVEHAPALPAGHVISSVQLPEMQRLLRLRASGLSEAQRADYAAALREALRQLSPAAPSGREAEPPRRAEHEIRHQYSDKPQLVDATRQESAAAVVPPSTDHSAADAEGGDPSSDHSEADAEEGEDGEGEGSES